MSNDDHAFCRLLLRNARRDARHNHVMVPNLNTWMTNSSYAEVRTDDGTVVWEGEACCRWAARTKVIERMIEVSL